MAYAAAVKNRTWCGRNRRVSSSSSGYCWRFLAWAGDRIESEECDVKVMFVHSHRFLAGDDGKVYSPGQFPYATWERYLAWCDELVVIGRCHTMHENDAPPSTLTLSSGPRVTFFFVPEYTRPWSFLRTRRNTVAILQRQMRGVDGIIARTSTLGELAAGIARRMNKPCAIEVVGCAWDALWNHGSWIGRAIAPLSFWGQRRMVSRSNFAIYVTREFLQRRYPCYGRIAGVSDVEIDESDENTLVKRLDRIFNQEGRVVFGVIGSLATAYKGLQTALHALAQMQTGMSGCELRILGGGDTRRWKAMAECLKVDRQVVFCGVLPSGQAVLDWLDDVDVYLQPSFAEGLPRAVVEAMSRGCPVIASEVGGIPELLPPAVLHSAGDSLQMSKMMERAAMDKMWQATQARRNFEEARRFQRSVLQGDRDAFWKMFADHVALETGRTGGAGSARALGGMG